jgi:hypothetical protein
MPFGIIILILSLIYYNFLGWKRLTLYRTGRKIVEVLYGGIFTE